ncbi:hypothetical protein G6F32_014381 [Rhizopus arrhizus]|nr:hypothetical protein G6F32_014381 [Rhizopus arrhizus]
MPVQEIVMAEAKKIGPGQDRHRLDLGLADHHCRRVAAGLRVRHRAVLRPGPGRAGRAGLPCAGVGAAAGGAAAADAGFPRGPAHRDDLPAAAAAVRPADGGRRHQRVRKRTRGR